MMFKQSTARLPVSRRQRLLPLLIIPGMTLAALAQAQTQAAGEGDVVRVHVGISATHEDNILGTSNAAIAAGAPKLSDTARRVEAGLIFDKTISQQRLTASLNLDRTSFNRFSNLDYNGRDIRANWNWHAGKHLEGNLGATHVRALTSVQDSLTVTGLPSQLPNVRTQDRQYFDASWRLHPSWRLRGGLSHYELDYAQTGPQVANRTVNDGEVGVDYLARSGSSIGLQYRHAEGEFQFSPLNDYSQDEIKGRVDWKLTGKTDLLFLAGWVQRDNDLAPANDFSGFNGRVNATWRATGKTTVNASLWREIGALDDQTASYSLNRGISLGAGWEITQQLRLDGYYQHERRDYTPANLARKDRVNYGSLQLSYYPIRKLRIQTAVYRTAQGSDVAANAYRNVGVSLGTRYEF
ncbi:XrtB/PEP-CTERM-associated polysaccharide biosynthesis outer membrane protein EpsL [Noviherbaspirillum sedimenti]|nr:XrtB/PEP-CTERM-associated polysaccharide biosynthesis outer membrane protein EpsL [Noviherbaspirillum sedimenti]